MARVLVAELTCYVVELVFFRRPWSTASLTCLMIWPRSRSRQHGPTSVSLHGVTYEALPSLCVHIIMAYSEATGVREHNQEVLD
jgi:hypothetical protein